MKQVRVVKFLSKESVDEYILKLAENKKQRNDLVMGEGNASNDKGLSKNEEYDKLSIGKVLASIFENDSSSQKKEPTTLSLLQQLFHHYQCLRFSNPNRSLDNLSIVRKFI